MDGGSALKRHEWRAHATRSITPAVFLESAMAETAAVFDRHAEADDSASVELILAAAENDVIGRGNRLPWRLSADLRRFKALTLGKSVLMGRKTYESIGKALPGRSNLVLTRSADFKAADCTVVDSLRRARDSVGAGGVLMVIGGADVYRLSLPYAARIHLTLVHARIDDGDTWFADWRNPPWIEALREPHTADAENQFDYTFVTLERRRPPAAAACG
jgi:dihydrofolate reductase